MVRLHKQLNDILSEIAEASNQPIPDGALDPQVPLEMLGETDVMLRVDIRAYTKDGEVFRVTGLNSIPHILADEMHLEAARNFEEMYHSTVTRPALNRFNAFLSRFTKTKHDDLNEPAFQGLPGGDPQEDPEYISESE